jgi:hypothetical protein
MIEFYSANIVARLLHTAHPLHPLSQRFVTRATLGVIGIAIVVGGCATAPSGPGYPPATPSAPPLPRTAEPPPPSVNLSGFPLPYRQGYADGCASVAGPERKDAERFSGDPNYRMGWQDGLALCRKK